jgi:TM2 domain-containing membrane protein YozV
VDRQRRHNKMKCANHPMIDGIAVCAECGRSFCAECSVELDHRRWCRDCLSKIVAKSGVGARAHPGMRKLAAALLSIIPGAGHMFLGLIGKGFALMGLLFLSIFLIILYASATGMYWLMAYLIPTLGVLGLSYAVFDTMAIADAQRSGREARSPEDDETMKAVWERVLLNKRTTGWIILVAGVVGVLDFIAGPISQLMDARFPITALVIPVALFILGIVLLKRSRKVK